MRIVRAGYYPFLPPARSRIYTSGSIKKMLSLSCLRMLLHICAQRRAEKHAACRGRIYGRARVAFVLAPARLNIYIILMCVYVYV